MDTETPTALFYARCDAGHREFFSALLYDWRQAGQPAEPEGDAVVLRLRAALRADEAGLPELFRLLPTRGVEPPVIELAADRWRRWFGEEGFDAFREDLAGIEGLAVRSNNERIQLVEPGHLSGPGQKALRDLLIAWAHRAQEVMGR